MSLAFDPLRDVLLVIRSIIEKTAMMANGNILCAGYLELVFTPGHRPAQVEPSHYNNFDDISSPPPPLFATSRTYRFVLNLLHTIYSGQVLAVTNCQCAAKKTVLCLKYE